MELKLKIKSGFKINGEIWENHIMNDGLIKMLQILNGDVTTNVRLKYLKFGTSSATPDDRTLTDLVAGVGNKYLISSYSVGGSFPFELELTTIIPDTDLTPRPYSLYEIGVYYEPESGGTLFARAVRTSPLILGVGASMPVNYSLIVV